jgi:hypothetical protein
VAAHVAEGLDWARHRLPHPRHEHEMLNDQCGKPEHRYCAWCGHTQEYMTMGKGETRLPTPKMIDEAVNWWGPHIRTMHDGQAQRYARILRHATAVLTGHPDATFIANEAAEDGWRLVPMSPSVRDALRMLGRALRAKARR